MKKTQLLVIIAVLGACLLLAATIVFFQKKPGAPMQNETTYQRASQDAQNGLTGEFGWESRPNFQYQMDRTGTERSDATDDGQDIKEPVAEGSTLPSSEKQVQEQTNPTQTQKPLDPDSNVVPSEEETGTTTAKDVPDMTISEIVQLTYDAYMALTPKEQKAYRKSFGDEDAFLAWFRMAQDAYANGKTNIEITGPIDMEQLTKGEA